MREKNQHIERFHIPKTS